MSTINHNILASRLALASLGIAVIKAFLYPNPLWSKPIIFVSLLFTLAFLVWQALAIAKGAKWAVITFLLFFFIGAAENLYHYKRIADRFDVTPVQELFNLVCWGLSIAAVFFILKQPKKTLEQYP